MVRPETLDDIYKVVDEYNTIHNLPRPFHDTEFRAFYRGQSNSCWDITPSASRVKYDERSMYLNSEKEIKGGTLFSQIAYLQHYREEKGYGTRFIDFTTDIDVALFFACCDSDNLDKDGVLFIYSYGWHKPRSIETTLFSELVIAEDGIIDIEDFVNTVCRKHYKEVDEYMRENYSVPWYDKKTLKEIECLLMAFLDYGFMVCPDEEESRRNIRIKRQKGCFYICGVDFTEDISGIRRYHSQIKRQFISHSYNVPEDLKNGSRLVKCCINKDLKSEILEYLRNKGIDHNYLMGNNRR